MHRHPAKSGAAAQGRCVRATVKFVPAYTTKAFWKSCTLSSDPVCEERWEIDDTGAVEAWAAGLGLPADSIPTETINLPLETEWLMVESSETDAFVLGLGLGMTALTLIVVSVGRRRYLHSVKAR